MSGKCFHRIRGVVSFLLVAAVAGCGKKSGDATPVANPSASNRIFLNFTHDWFPEPEHGGYFAAKIKGIWSDVGLEVNIAAGGPNSEIEKRVALDPIGIGLVRGDAVIEAVERGLPIIVINSYFQHDPQGIMVRADSPIHGFQDLEDRDLAMQVGNTWFLYLQKKYSLKKTRVRPVTGSVANFVKDPNWIVQAYPTSEPYYALKAGVKSRMLQISDSGFDPYRVVIANRLLVQNHPEWVAKFSLGAYRGWQEYYRNPLPVHEYILRISPTMEIEGMKFSYAKMRELRLVEGDPNQGEALGTMLASRWESTGKILLDLGVVKKLPPWSDIYTTNFTPDRVGATTDLPPPVWSVTDVQWPAGVPHL